MAHPVLAPRIRGLKLDARGPRLLVPCVRLGIVGIRGIRAAPAVRGLSPRVLVPGRRLPLEDHHLDVVDEPGLPLHRLPHPDPQNVPRVPVRAVAHPETAVECPVLLEPERAPRIHVKVGPRLVRGVLGGLRELPEQAPDPLPAELVHQGPVRGVDLVEELRERVVTQVVDDGADLGRARILPCECALVHDLPQILADQGEEGPTRIPRGDPVDDPGSNEFVDLALRVRSQVDHHEGPGPRTGSPARGVTGEEPVDLLPAQGSIQYEGLVHVADRIIGEAPASVETAEGQPHGVDGYGPQSPRCPPIDIPVNPELRGITAGADDPHEEMPPVVRHRRRARVLAHVPRVVPDVEPNLARAPVELDTAPLAPTQGLPEAAYHPRGPGSGLHPEGDGESPRRGDNLLVPRLHTGGPAEVEAVTMLAPRAPRGVGEARMPPDVTQVVRLSPLGLVEAVPALRDPEEDVVEQLQHQPRDFEGAPEIHVHLHVLRGDQRRILHYDGVIPVDVRCPRGGAALRVELHVLDGLPREEIQDVYDHTCGCVDPPGLAAAGVSVLDSDLVLGRGPSAPEPDSETGVDVRAQYVRADVFPVPAPRGGPTLRHGHRREVPGHIAPRSEALGRRGLEQGPQAGPEAVVQEPGGLVDLQVAPGPVGGGHPSLPSSGSPRAGAPGPGGTGRCPCPPGAASGTRRRWARSCGGDARGPRTPPCEARRAPSP